MKKAEGKRLRRPRSLPDEVVEEILTRRAEGETFKAIAENLNNRGVPAAQGGRQWYPATVRKVVVTYD